MDFVSGRKRASVNCRALGMLGLESGHNIMLVELLILIKWQVQLVPDVMGYDQKTEKVRLPSQ